MSVGKVGSVIGVSRIVYSKEFMNPENSYFMKGPAALNFT